MVVFHQGGWSFTVVIFHQGRLLLWWSFAVVVFHQGGLLLWRSLIRVVFHCHGPSSGWSFTVLVFDQGGLLLCWSFIKLVFHQGGLLLCWSFIKLVFHQVGLLLWWSFTVLVFDQGGLLLCWSFIMVVFYCAGLSSSWSFTVLVFHQVGLLLCWSFIKLVFYYGGLSSGRSFIRVVFYYCGLQFPCSGLSSGFVCLCGGLSSGWSFTVLVFHQGTGWSFLEVVYHQVVFPCHGLSLWWSSTTVVLIMVAFNTSITVNVTDSLLLAAVVNPKVPVCTTWQTQLIHLQVLLLPEIKACCLTWLPEMSKTLSGWVAQRRRFSARLLTVASVSRLADSFNICSLNPDPSASMRGERSASFRKQPLRLRAVTGLDGQWPEHRQAQPLGNKVFPTALQSNGIGYPLTSIAFKLLIGHQNGTENTPLQTMP